MKFEGRTLSEALASEKAGAADLALAYGTQVQRPVASSGTISGLIVRYKMAPDGFVRIAPKTKVNWRRSLDLIDAKFGDLPLKALGAKGVKKVMIGWRNGFKDTPRQADVHMTVLKRLLSWAVENEEIDTNPVKGVPGLYSGHRAELVVGQAALEAILSKATPEARLAIRFAAATGIRREDICKIRWSYLDGDFVQFATGKSRGKTTVTVPLLGDAAAVVAEVWKEREKLLAQGVIPSAFMFVTPRKTPWKPDSLTQAFARAAQAAGVEGRTLNDLRGTAITRFAAAGFSNENIAGIVGWELTRVENIKRHYVDPSNVARKLMDQLERAEKTG